MLELLIRYLWFSAVFVDKETLKIQSSALLSPQETITQNYMGFDMNIKHVCIKSNIEGLLTQMFTGVLHQNYLEGYIFRPQGRNL